MRYVPGVLNLHGMVQKGSRQFEILSGEEIVVTGTIKMYQPNEEIFSTNRNVDITDGDAVQMSGNEIYHEFKHREHKYGGLFKAMKSVTITEEGSVATSRWDDNWSAFLEAMIQQYLLHEGESTQSPLTISSIRRIALSFPSLPKEQCGKSSFHYNNVSPATAIHNKEFLRIRKTSF